MNRSNETWVKNVCQKLEAMCMDIDEFVCKEPVLYVGNQMQAVGENVRNFCSAVMHDFVLTQVVDPVQHLAPVIPSKCINLVEASTNKPKDAPLVPNELCHKQSSLCHSEQITSEISKCPIGESDSHNTIQVHLNSSTNSQALDNKSEQEGVLYDVENSDWIENVTHLNLEIEKKIEGGPLMKLEEKKMVLNKPVDEFECDSDNFTTHKSSELGSLITCNEIKEENSNHILRIPAGISPETLLDSLNPSFINATVESDTIDCNPTETVDYFSVSSYGLSSCESSTAIASDSNNEASVSCSRIGNFDGYTVDFEEIKMETVDLSDKKLLVESCVNVEGVGLSFFPNMSRSKSYKKMIQDAFMSRKRLTKEYRQLAIWHGELSQPTEENKLAAQDFPDSEWEIL